MDKIDSIVQVNIGAEQNGVSCTLLVMTVTLYKYYFPRDLAFPARDLTSGAISLYIEEVTEKSVSKLLQDT
jgi:hypothetical protein